MLRFIPRGVITHQRNSILKLVWLALKIPTWGTCNLRRSGMVQLFEEYKGKAEWVKRWERAITICRACVLVGSIQKGVITDHISVHAFFIRGSVLSLCEYRREGLVDHVLMVSFHGYSSISCMCLVWWTKGGEIIYPNSVRQYPK